MIVAIVVPGNCGFAIWEILAGGGRQRLFPAEQKAWIPVPENTPWLTVSH